MKKVFISIFLLLYSIFAFSQATFAWISLSTKNTLDGMDMTATTESGMEVSLDGVNFSTEITADMIRREIGNIIRLDDITSLDGINFQKDLKDNSTIAVGNKDYITFTLWFRTSLPTTKYLYLVDNISSDLNYELAKEQTLDGTYVVSKGTEWINDREFDNGNGIVEIGTKDIYYAANAIRISFVEKAVEDSLLGTEDLREDLISKIYDPSENETRGYGKEIGAVSYYKAKSGDDSISLPTIIPSTIYSLTTFKNPYEAMDNTSQIATFQKGEAIEGISYLYAKVNINIWLEGWDADCLNAVYNDLVLVQLKFRGARLASES